MSFLDDMNGTGDREEEYYARVSKKVEKRERNIIYNVQFLFMYKSKAIPIYYLEKNLHVKIIIFKPLVQKIKIKLKKVVLKFDYNVVWTWEN